MVRLPRTLRSCPDRQNGFYDKENPNMLPEAAQPFCAASRNTFGFCLPYSYKPSWCFLSYVIYNLPVTRTI